MLGIGSALAVLLALNGAASASDWHTALTPHFEVEHQLDFQPPGFSMGLERIHSRLRLDLAGFSPWMSRERLKLFLYRDRRSYAEGKFQPPPWSNGVSMYEKRTVAVYDQRDRDKLMQVIAHETTHLLFESYWGEAGRQPPSWINEGLAMVEEADPEHPEQSDWFRAMVFLPEKGYLHVADLVKLTPTLDLNDNKAGVEAFYAESYSLVYFLIRRHTRLQFKSFCAKLRDGADLDQALWLTYRYKGAAQLEAAWLEWLRDPRLRSKAEDSIVAARRAEAAESDSGGADPGDGAPDQAQPPARAKPRRFGAIEGFKPLGD